MICGTKIYTVHVNPDLPQAYEKPVFIREGFNIYALIFLFVWAFYHRLWLHGMALVVAQAGLMYLDKHDILSPVTVTVAVLHPSSWPDGVDALTELL